MEQHEDILKIENDRPHGTSEDWEFFLSKCVKKYQYKKFPKYLSEKVKKYYYDSMPLWLKNYNGEPIYSPKGVYLAKKLSDRHYVIGDYGIYAEIDKEDMIIDNLIVQPGQEYRIHDKNYSKRVKYNWVCPKSLENIKIYHQKRRVEYADYIPGKFYISPFEL